MGYGQIRAFDDVRSPWEEWVQVSDGRCPEYTAEELRRRVEGQYERIRRSLTRRMVERERERGVWD